MKTIKKWQGVFRSYQTSKVERFAKIVSNCKLLTVFAKQSIWAVWQCSEDLCICYWRLPKTMLNRLILSFNTQKPSAKENSFCLSELRNLKKVHIQVIKWQNPLQWLSWTSFLVSLIRFNFKLGYGFQIWYRFLSKNCPSNYICNYTFPRVFKVQCLSTISMSKVTKNVTFISQPASTCSKLTIETLEKGVKYVQS